jgi:hypothetical protein
MERGRATMSQDSEQSPYPTPTLSPNTTPEPRPADFSTIASKSTPTKVDESAAALELALQKEADERREERFYWICGSTVLIDIASFPHIGWIGIICIFVLEIAILFGLARKYADEKIAIALERILISICEKFGWK